MKTLSKTHEAASGEARGSPGLSGHGKPSASREAGFEVIAGRLAENAGTIQFGSVAVGLKIHCGRIADVTYTITENRRERGGENE